MTSSIKVTMVGDTQSGKSSIVLRYINSDFSQQIEPTLGASYMSKQYTYHHGKTITFQIWDAAGMQKYKTIAPIYYKARVVVCVFDITSLESFAEMQSYVKEVMQVNPNALIVIVGNKTDLFQQIKIPYNYASGYAQANGALFALTSAKHNTGINQLMIMIAQRIQHLQSIASPASAP